MVGQDEMDVIAADLQANLVDIGNGAVKCQCAPHRDRVTFAALIRKNGREYAHAVSRPEASVGSTADLVAFRKTAEIAFRDWYAELAHEKGWETVNA